jgi:hypothetical protein
VSLCSKLACGFGAKVHTAALLFGFEILLKQLDIRLAGLAFPFHATEISVYSDQTTVNSLLISLVFVDSYV